MTEHIQRPVNLVAILGSVRPANRTSMVLNQVEHEVREMDGISLYIIDPSKYTLMMPGLGSTDDARTIKSLIALADGVILATPEYHGSYSSVIKLVIDNLGYPSALAGKPVSLIGVASGRIGAVKAIEHLRGVVAHVGGLALPGSVSVANVRNVFSEEGTLIDDQLSERLRRLIDHLLTYVRMNTCPVGSMEADARDMQAVS